MESDEDDPPTSEDEGSSGSVYALDDAERRHENALGSPCKRARSMDVTVTAPSISSNFCPFEGL